MCSSTKVSLEVYAVDYGLDDVLVSVHGRDLGGGPALRVLLPEVHIGAAVIQDGSNNVQAAFGGGQM